MRQVLPVHRSAKVRMIPSVPTYWPTATHEVAVAHDTPENCALGAEVSTGGTACTDHGDFAAAADADAASPAVRTPATATAQVAAASAARHRPAIRTAARLIGEVAVIARPPDPSARVPPWPSAPHPARQ